MVTLQRIRSPVPSCDAKMAITPRVGCSGLADPGPVAAALWTDRELEAGVTLDAVVTVADASRLDGQLAAAPAVSAANEAEQQIAHADVVLLNKVLSWRLRSGRCGLELTPVSVTAVHSAEVGLKTSVADLVGASGEPSLESTKAGMIAPCSLITSSS